MLSRRLYGYRFNASDVGKTLQPIADAITCRGKLDLQTQDKTILTV